MPRDRTITVTASPSKGLEATFDLAERLHGHGYVVVPHLAARMVSGRSELEEIVDRLVGKGITRVFVPGGDAEPTGDYLDALGLLELVLKDDDPTGGIQRCAAVDELPDASRDAQLVAGVAPMAAG